jgi:hypothetical protein
VLSIFHKEKQIMMKVRKRYNKTPSRRKIPGVGAQTTRAVRTPIDITFISYDAPSKTALFRVDQPFVLHGVPPVTVDPGPGSPVSAVLAGGLDFTITFDADITGMNIDWGFENPGVRNMAGGYALPFVASLP